MQVENLKDGWIKLTSAEDLKLGEYALVEMLDQNQFNSYAWDFGVNPKAHENRNAERAKPAANDDRDTLPPQLEPREK